MYSSGPDKKDTLDFEKTAKFIKTIDWSMINQIGFYGGEVSINLDLYKNFIDSLPDEAKQKRKFTITNGVWSDDLDKTYDFMNFCIDYDLYLIISGTPFHKQFQDIERLEFLKETFPTCIRLKGDDIIHPMGRASIENWSCTKKCMTYEVPTRLGLFPNGDILFQNCDGVYPVVQTYNETFVGITKRINKLKGACHGTETNIKRCWYQR